VGSQLLQDGQPAHYRHPDLGQSHIGPVLDEHPGRLEPLQLATALIPPAASGIIDTPERTKTSSSTATTLTGPIPLPSAATVRFFSARPAVRRRHVQAAPVSTRAR